MHFLYFCMVICVFSAVHASSVQLGFVESPSIHDALEAAKAASNKTPTLVLSTDNQIEEKNSDLSSLISLTILGQKPNGTVISPPNTSDVIGRHVFSIKSPTTFSNLILSDLTLERFIINSELESGANLSPLTVSMSGPVTFRENNGYLCGAIHSKVPLTLSGIGPTIFTQNSSVAGGAIHSEGPLNISCPVTFNWNNAKQVGGAIWGRFVTFSGSNPITFTRNSTVNNHGGAIYAESVVFSGTGPVTFTGNWSTQGNGGAICANSLTLTDTNFLENKATKGGAVFICGVQFTYTTNNLTRLNPAALPPVIGDNDLACESLLGLVPVFTKMGKNALVLNTNNSGWIGNTVIKEGAFIIGEQKQYDGAVWGGNGNIISVKGGARIGGFGTINANTVTFENASVWCLFFAGDKTGKLNVQGTFTLPTGIDVKETSGGTIPTDGIVVATYGTLVGDLKFLNTQLIYHNLSLEKQVVDSQSNRLVLKPLHPAPFTPAPSDSKNESSHIKE